MRSLRAFHGCMLVVLSAAGCAQRTDSDADPEPAASAAQAIEVPEGAAGWLPAGGSPCHLHSSGPRFCLALITSAVGEAGVPFELAVIPAERHASWSYAWSDGLPPAQRGELRQAAPGDGARVSYLPATCAALRQESTSRRPSVALSLTVTDGRTGASASASVPVVIDCPPPTYLTTETLYSPQEERRAYEAAPAGFEPVFTELVARHGARGMSSEGDDLATYNLWLRAQAEGALTPLGEQLGPDLLAFVRANTVLGAGVPGITAPGYGNLTQLGAAEHEKLAARLFRRLHGHFAHLAASGRKIVVETSGVNRAYDSSGYFVRGLEDQDAALAPLVVYPPAQAGYGTKPKTQLPGTNRFALYFHKLSAAQDQVTDPADPHYPTYQASLAYQSFKASDPIQTRKVAAVQSVPAGAAAARAILGRLFAPEFLERIGTNGYQFVDGGVFTFTGADGKSYTTTGSGETVIRSVLDAATALYSVYVIAPAMARELGGIDFGKYVRRAEAEILAYQNDATDFYQMGPGATESGDATYAMARGLEDDFFREVDAIAHGDLTTGAKLRFTHAEIMVPFTSILGLKNVFVQSPQADTYTYSASSAWNGDLVSPAVNPWRDEIAAPMAANVQWDVYRDGQGTLLVEMMLNEKEVDFKVACDGARRAPGSHFYDYAKLKACHGE